VQKYCVWIGPYSEFNKTTVPLFSFSKNASNNLYVYMCYDTNKVSISPTFCTRVFRMKANFGTFLSLLFGFVTFCQKDIVEKSARKILMKLTKYGFVGMSYKSSVCDSFVGLRSQVHQHFKSSFFVLKWFFLLICVYCLGLQYFRQKNVNWMQVSISQTFY